MALPIKETPVLTGRDAVTFSEAIEENEKKSVSQEEWIRTRELVKLVLKNSDIKTEINHLAIDQFYILLRPDEPGMDIFIRSQIAIPSLKTQCETFPG